MRKGYYLPQSDKARLQWLANFSTQLTVVGATVGIDPTEVDAVRKDYLALDYIIQMVEIFKGEHQERTKYKDIMIKGKTGSHLGDMPSLPPLPAPPEAVPAGIFKRINKMVQRIKNHPNYNEAIGRALEIIGPEKHVNLNEIMVEMTKVRAQTDHISISFKKGPFDGVAVYEGRLRAGTEGGPAGDFDWTLLEYVSFSPYTDRRPNKGNQPETRYYMMRYLKNNQLVGKNSNTLKVVADVY